MEIDDDDDDDSSSEEEEEEDDSSNEEEEDSSSFSSSSSSSTTVPLLSLGRVKKKQQQQPETGTPEALVLNPGLEWRETQLEACAFIREREEAVRYGRGTKSPNNPEPLIWVTEAPNAGIRGGMVLAKMGSGKTGMIFRTAFETKSVTGWPTLVVVNPTLLREAQRELHKLFPKAMHKRVIFFHQSFMAKRGYDYDTFSRADLKGIDLVFVTYTQVQRTCYLYGFEEEVIVMSEGKDGSVGKMVSVDERTFVQADKVKGYKGPALIFGVPWNRVILDESQIMRNPTARTAIALMAVYGLYKWALSGTPLVNGAADMWTQLRFLGYKGCDKVSHWRKEYKQMMVRDHIKSSILYLTGDDVALPPVHRLKVELELSAFEKDIYKKTLEISKRMLALVSVGDVTFAYMMAMFVYLRQCMIAPYLLTTDSKQPNLFTTKKKKKKQDNTPSPPPPPPVSGIGLGTAVMESYFESADIDRYKAQFQAMERARQQQQQQPPSGFGMFKLQQQQPSLPPPPPPPQAIKAPIEDMLDEEVLNRALDEAKNDLIREGIASGITGLLADINGPAGIYSTTMTAMVERLAAINANPETKGQKVLVFSHYVTALNLASYTVDKRLSGIQWLKLDGTVPVHKRAMLIDEFRTNPEIQVLFLNSTIGSLGLNLTEANWGIFLDNWWNEMVPSQGVARMHRFGQTREVTIYEFLRKDTIDARIMEIRTIKDINVAYFTSESNTSRRGPGFKMGRGAGIDMYTMTRILK